MPGQLIGDILNLSDLIIYTFGKILLQNKSYTNKELKELLRKQPNKRLANGFGNFPSTYCRLVDLKLFKRIKPGLYRCIGTKEDFLQVIKDKYTNLNFEEKINIPVESVPQDNLESRVENLECQLKTLALICRTFGEKIDELVLGKQ